MPEGCIATECRECKYHVIVNGRLDCNWMNRLGIKGSVEQYTEPPKEEVLKKKIEQKEKELEELKKSMEELKKIEREISKAEGAE